MFYKTEHEGSTFRTHYVYELQYFVPVSVYSETSIYRSLIIRFPGSVIQFLWSLSESYFSYGSRIYCFPGSIVSFPDPRRKR
jgi:hypothetical protein